METATKTTVGILFTLLGIAFIVIVPMTKDSDRIEATFVSLCGLVLLMLGLYMIV